MRVMRAPLICMDRLLRAAWRRSPAHRGFVSATPRLFWVFAHCSGTRAWSPHLPPIKSAAGEEPGEKHNRCIRCGTGRHGGGARTSVCSMSWQHKREHVTMTSNNGCNVSLELLTWVDIHRAELRSKVSLFREVQVPEGSAELLKKFASNPSLLIQAWRELEQNLESMGAPSNVRSEAAKLTAQMDESRTESILAAPHQEQIRKLAEEFIKAPSIENLESLVDRKIQGGQLSELVGLRIVQRARQVHGKKDDLHKSPPEGFGFSWGGCAFCGLLAAEGGPGASAGACIVCGILLD